MHIIQYNEEDQDLEVRWTWLPWWLGSANHALMGALATLKLERFVAHRAPTDAELAAMHTRYCALLIEAFPTQKEELKIVFEAFERLPG